MNQDELREAAEIAGTRAFPAHPHFRGTGAALYIAGYEAEREQIRELTAELTIAKQVLQLANIEILPDGSHRFKPKAVKYYCGELTAERLHKADGMANEVNILTKENRELTAERDKYRDACERLIGHYGSWELWGEAWSEDGKQSGFADKYLGFEIESDGDNGYDFARQVKAELEGK